MLVGYTCIRVFMKTEMQLLLQTRFRAIIDRYARLVPFMELQITLGM